jgi:hypothetical protein
MIGSMWQLWADLLAEVAANPIAYVGTVAALILARGTFRAFRNRL